MAGSTIGFAGMRVDTMTLLCLLLFVGAMGKSAQLPLHTWLPDAMEGPTPVSALIHAATMVTAGVFMVCRLSPMFEISPTAMHVVTWVGAITCFFAATVGCAQNDIKRVIAYSTCSQLGYMFFAAGVGAYGAAMFHLFTHAFFKALLFLGAGSVIHAMHHEQDMRYYGALRKEIPITFWVMVVGTLAITGVGLDVGGGIGFAGFWSKDAIIEAAWASGSVAGTIAFWLGVLVALLTSFYSWRLIFLTFFGEPRWAASEHIQHAVHGEHEDRLDEEHGDSAHDAGLPATGTGGYHPHESPLTMLVPICLLGGRRACSRASSSTAFSSIPSARRTIWRGSIAFSRELAEAARKLGLVGQALADHRHAARPVDRLEQLHPQSGAPRPLRRAPSRAIYRFVSNKWYFDELYDVHLRPSGAVARPPVLEAAATRARSTASARTARPMRSASATASPRGCSRAISIPTRW